MTIPFNIIYFALTYVTLYFYSFFITAGSRCVFVYWLVRVFVGPFHYVATFAERRPVGGHALDFWLHDANAKTYNNYTQCYSTKYSPCCNKNSIIQLQLFNTPFFLQFIFIFLLLFIFLFNKLRRGFFSFISSLSFRLYLNGLKILKIGS